MQGLVIREVDSLRNLATCFNYPDGVDMANQALANFYFNIGLDEEGIQLSREILSRMEERNASRMRWYYVLRLFTKDLRLEYLNKLDSCIQECEKEGHYSIGCGTYCRFFKRSLSLLLGPVLRGGKRAFLGLSALEDDGGYRKEE